MVDRPIVARKIAALRDAVARIQEVLPEDLDRFLDDRTAREVVALNLLVAIEEAVDLATHWLADEGREVPDTYAEVFRAMARAGVIEVELGRRLAGAVALRNLIAHRYGVLDWSRVHSIASHDLGDLEAFAAALAKRATV